MLVKFILLLVPSSKTIHIILILEERRVCLLNGCGCEGW